MLSIIWTAWCTKGINPTELNIDIKIIASKDKKDLRYFRHKAKRRKTIRKLTVEGMNQEANKIIASAVDRPNRRITKYVLLEASG